jgi:DNA invertase Pin-like site-specific DNA recombinase
MADIRDAHLRAKERLEAAQARARRAYESDEVETLDEVAEIAKCDRRTVLKWAAQYGWKRGAR